MTTLNCEKDTKSALLDCAERLFLAKGFEAVSVREITDAAGANVAAVNYHFSSKTELYRACLKRRLGQIAHRRIALIEKVSSQGRPSTLQQIISTYVRDSFEEMLRNPDGGRLLQTIYQEMSPAGVASDLVTSELIAPIHQALLRAIRKASPELPDKHISRCISSLSGQILHFIRFRDIIGQFLSSGSETAYVDEITQHITDFSLRGIGSMHHV
jgi:AcrR family transcriptional regulator